MIDHSHKADHCEPSLLSSKKEKFKACNAMEMVYFCRKVSKPSLHSHILRSAMFICRWLTALIKEPEELVDSNDSGRKQKRLTSFFR